MAAKKKLIEFFCSDGSDSEEDLGKNKGLVEVEDVGGDHRMFRQ